MEESLVRVIKGPDENVTATLLQGQTVLGRGSKAGLKLSPATVSWEHAVITRNGDVYILENLSAHGTWLNDAKVAGRMSLKPRDVIKLADDVWVRFEPSGMPQGLLARRNLLIAGALILVLGGLVVALDPFSGPSGPPADWNRTHRIIKEWLETQNQLPATVLQLYETGWRCHVAGDEREAHTQWLQLQLLLDRLEPQWQFNAFSASKPKALREMVTALPDSHLLKPTDDEAKAALVQFTRFYLDWSGKYSKDAI